MNYKYIIENIYLNHQGSEIKKTLYVWVWATTKSHIWNVLLNSKKINFFFSVSIVLERFTVSFMIWCPGCVSGSNPNSIPVTWGNLKFKKIFLDNSTKYTLIIGKVKY